VIAPSSAWRFSMLASEEAALAALLAQQDFDAEALEQDWAFAVAIPSAKKNDNKKIAFFMSVRKSFACEKIFVSNSGFKSKLRYLKKEHF
jgi:hypothetical protein